MSSPAASPPPRSVLITGGASGFGLDIATRLANAGAKVAIFDHDTERLEAAVRLLGSDALALQGDVRSPQAVREATAESVEKLGGLDALVLSAGVIHVKPLAEVTEDDWDRTLDVNLKGAFLAIQAAAPALCASGRGRIVAISSDAGRRGSPWIHAYSASKFGLVGLIEAVAAELASEGVTANSVCPVGCPTTSMGQQLVSWKAAHGATSAEAIIDATARTNPLGRNATEADVAEAVLFFLRDEASFLTGVALDVDGGAHLGFIPGAST